jgi:hypothetical protein
MKYIVDYHAVDGTVICTIPPIECLNMSEINRIAKYTVNTWQGNRDIQETLDNTVQGKMAEYVLEKYLERETNIRYISYDMFRRDGYKKHAPFDGLLYSIKTSADILTDLIEGIVIEVSDSDTGQITEQMRERLEEYKVFTVEIKSSQLRQRDYEGVEHVKFPRYETDYKKIVSNIRRWDFFVYPHYTRKSDSISSFYEYAEFVRKRKEFLNQGNQSYLRQLILTEYRNASDIYTRLYFDYQTNEIFIPGYIIKEDFFKNPKIGKMPGGKSGMALYYMKSISDGSSFLEIEHNERIWMFERLNAYRKLFAYAKRLCPSCGKELQICNAKARYTYSYRCFKCEKWFAIDEIEG